LLVRSLVAGVAPPRLATHTSPELLTLVRLGSSFLAGTVTFVKLRDRFLLDELESPNGAFASTALISCARLEVFVSRAVVR